MVQRTPQPGSDEERSAFALLQQSFAPMYRRLFADESLERTVVVVPSLSLSEGELSKLDGVLHYEERMLCLLLLLRMPRTRVIYVTSMPVADSVVDYHLDLIPEAPDAASRLLMMSLDDPTLEPLSSKLTKRPDMLTRIRTAIEDPASAHLTCFAATPYERTLAVSLGVPMYAADPDLWHLGTKSEGRRVFRQARVPVPTGREDVRNVGDVVSGLAELQARDVGRAVVKLNEGFSGEGNAVIDLTGAAGADPVVWIGDHLPRSIEFEAVSETWDSYRRKLEFMGGIVEAFMEGEEVTSPSVQCRIEPTGAVTIISTHDQILGGPHNQVYLGCRFPADPVYRKRITEAAFRVADVLARRGVIGRFGVDFLAVRSGDDWSVYGLEINLRKGGTTLPFLMLDYLTRGRYDPEFGEYRVSAGDARVYHASDNVRSPLYVGMDVGDARRALGHLAFSADRRIGVTMHLLGALPEHGKLGLVAIAEHAEAAAELFHQAVQCLDTFAMIRSGAVAAYG
jgi:hypothetical protein